MFTKTPVWRWPVTLLLAMVSAKLSVTLDFYGTYFTSQDSRSWVQDLCLDQAGRGFSGTAALFRRCSLTSLPG
jgi:hypothetical protein